MDDILLMAYVDGELTPHRRKEVEDAISTSDDIAERVAILEASVLPYQVAFQRQALPPVPDSLTRTFSDIARAFAVPLDITAAGSHRVAAPASSRDALAQPSTPIRSRRRVGALWLAAAFIAGAFCCDMVLRCTPGTAHSRLLAWMW